MTFLLWFLAWIGASVIGGILVAEFWIRLRDSAGERRGGEQA